MLEELWDTFVLVAWSVLALAFTARKKKNNNENRVNVTTDVTINNS